MAFLFIFHKPAFPVLPGKTAFIDEGDEASVILSFPFSLEKEKEEAGNLRAFF